jgi:hypothetical protein
MQWTCKIRKLNEARPHKIRDYGPTGPHDHESIARRNPLNAMRLLVTDPDRFVRMIETSVRQSMLYDTWYGVVVQYSARSLTFPSDKLPAIAGVAQMMHTNFGCEYGAGLWKEDLPVGLCWNVAKSLADDNNVPTKSDEDPDKAYIAPSWSWASIQNRGVGFRVDDDHRAGEVSAECAQVLDWEFTYPPGAVFLFGQVTSGVLTIRGHLQKASLIIHSLDGGSVWGARPLWSAHAIDAHTTSIIGEVALDTLDMYKALRRRYSDLSKMDRKSDYPSKLVSEALPVLCLTTYVADVDEQRHIFSLVLVPHSTGKQEYRRIGLLYNKVPAPSVDRPEVSDTGTNNGEEDQDRQIVRII